MIRKYFLTSISFILISFSFHITLAQTWEAKWITSKDSKDTINSWFAFRKDFEINAIPKHAVAKIAVDSKYWLWINDKLVVFEGGLKRGPNPRDTYFDEVDIAPFLKKGKNVIAIKLWFFGKEGFSHNSSGKAGLIFDCQTEGLLLLSDATWHARPLKAYQTAPKPIPNHRLPESSVLYDARLEYANWKDFDFNGKNSNAIEVGKAGVSPWNKLVLRPIPQWKDFGLKEYEGKAITYEKRGDTITCLLPYNAQFTPYLKVKAEAGKKIMLLTDNYLHYNGSAENIRAEYITKEGIQEYESLGWLNGHQMYYVIPKGVEILELKYRETGYDTEFDGSFTSDNAFLNKLWSKALRTLYVTMRDTYMDCPDRERAQWTGDAVLEAEEAFYALSPSSHSLAKKWLYELIGWQKDNGSLFSPIPAGNWEKELPGQVLASIGYYGIWTYYIHTGDLQTIEDLYPNIQRYLKLWEADGNGLVKVRKGDWTWGDWGKNKDIRLLYNLWYYLAIKGNYLMAVELGKVDDAEQFLSSMYAFKKEFNETFWNGENYRDPLYTGETDDRVHALAVVAGIADSSKYSKIMEVFAEQEHASPYMEKYVFEAMYQMGYPQKANERHERRFSKMVNNSYFTTLFEGWGIGGDGFGGGTVNHAWSGGGLTVISSYLCGIKPIEPGYKTFSLAPQPGDLKYASTKVASVAGDITASFNNKDGNFILEVNVPKGSKAIVTLPLNDYYSIRINNKELVSNGRINRKARNKYLNDSNQILIHEGKWKIDTFYK